jgi:hypothetical protein
VLSCFWWHSKEQTNRTRVLGTERASRARSLAAIAESSGERTSSAFGFVGKGSECVFGGADGTGDQFPLARRGHRLGLSIAPARLKVGSQSESSRSRNYETGPDDVQIKRQRAMMEFGERSETLRSKVQAYLDVEAESVGSQLLAEW